MQNLQENKIVYNEIWKNNKSLFNKQNKKFEFQMSKTVSKKKHDFETLQNFSNNYRHMKSLSKKKILFESKIFFSKIKFWIRIIFFFEIFSNLDFFSNSKNDFRMSIYEF